MSERKINWTVVYTVIVTTLVLAIFYLLYVELWEDKREKVVQLKIQLNSVEWLIYVNEHKLKKMDKVKIIEKEFVKREAIHYGHDWKEKCHDFEEKQQATKNSILQELEELKKQREEIGEKMSAYRIINKSETGE